MTPRPPQDGDDFGRFVLLIAFSAFLIATVFYFLWLGARKAKADIRAADADERIAAALERAYPVPPTSTSIPPLDADCIDVDRIRSLAQETGCALWGKENPCEPGKHLVENGGVGVSCATELTPPSMLHHADLKPIPQPDPDPCQDAPEDASHLAKRCGHLISDVLSRQYK